MSDLRAMKIAKPYRVEKNCVGWVIALDGRPVLHGIETREQADEVAETLNQVAEMELKEAK